MLSFIWVGCVVVCRDEVSVIFCLNYKSQGMSEICIKQLPRDHPVTYAFENHPFVNQKQLATTNYHSRKNTFEILYKNVLKVFC